MAEISYRRHRFPPVIIQHAVWLYLRFTLSYRDVEELLAERGLDVSYETVRSRVLKFGPIIARRLRRSRPRPSNRWHLDEVVVRVAGKHMYLWRAVDDEGEVLEILVQRRRDKWAAVKLMRKVRAVSVGCRVYAPLRAVRAIGTISSASPGWMRWSPTTACAAPCPRPICRRRTKRGSPRSSLTWKGSTFSKQ